MEIDTKKINYDGEIVCPSCGKRTDFNLVFETPIIGKSAIVGCVHCKSKIMITIRPDSHNGEPWAVPSAVQLSAEEAGKLTL